MVFTLYEFPGNTCVVQGQGAYLLYFEQKIHGKNFRALLKTAKSVKVLPSKTFPVYGMCLCET